MNNKEIKSIINFAITNEIEAYEFYKNAALKVKDSYLKETFEELAKEELRHEEFLKEFLTKEKNKIDIEIVDDYGISKEIDKPKLTVDMAFADAIGLAIKKEEEAMEMYKKLSESSVDEEEKEFFIGLMNMEKMHKTRLEDIYVNVAYNEIW